jgi:Flp pilus assembly protein TadG
VKLFRRIISRLTDLPRAESGGALVELAVILPILILISIGVMDYGRVYFTSVAVVNAARAGAEWGAFGEQGGYLNDTDIQNFAKLDGAEAGTITVTSNHECRCPGSGATVSCTTACSSGYGMPKVFVVVTATKTVNLILKYPGLPTSVTISRTATFRAQ